MKFKTPKEKFTHYGRFYGVPIYLNLDDEFVVAGRNIIFEYLLLFMTWVHNTFIEFGAQCIAALSNQPYEPGFPVWIVGEIEAKSEE